MMKRIFSLLFVAVACSVAALAQTSLVATLTHGSTISAYYGTSALKEAYAAADNSDIITLSSGTFAAVDIEKAITVRGAGVPLANDNPTVLTGNFIVTLPAATSSFMLEGVQCMDAVTFFSTNKPKESSLPSANILKCYFNNIVQCANVNPTFIHCVFENGLKSLSGYYSIYYTTNVNCKECAIIGASADGRVVFEDFIYWAKMSFDNCIIHQTTPGLEYSPFNNCIITHHAGYFNFGTNHYITNSLCIGTGFYITENTNTIIEADLSTIFKTFKGTFSPQETFELTDDAKAKYKGSDGTQVGIYGGTNPFDPTPTNPQIKKFDVSTSNIDGKLNVKINVE